MVEDRRASPDALVLLGVIASRDVDAEAHLSRIGFGLAGEDAEEAGLAGAVETEDEEPLASLDGELETLEHVVVAVGLGQAFDLETHPATVRRRREAHVLALLLGDRTDGLGLQPAGAGFEGVRRARPLHRP